MKAKNKASEKSKSVPTVAKKKLTADLELSEEQLKKVRGGMISTDEPDPDPTEPIPM